MDEAHPRRTDILAKARGRGLSSAQVWVPWSGASLLQGQRRAGVGGSKHWLASRTANNHNVLNVSLRNGFTHKCFGRKGMGELCTEMASLRFSF